MKSGILLWVLGFAVWIVLSWPPGLYTAVIGAFAALFATLIAGEMFVRRPHLAGDAGRCFYFLLYVPLFIWECFKANCDVAYRVSHPRMPIKPGILKVRTRLRSETGLTFLANSITLTPGTLSVDLDPENGWLYVHCIDAADTDVDAATRRIVEKFEKILCRIFE